MKADTRKSSTPNVAGSAHWTERARRVLPSGVTHDMRHLRPHPIYISHAAGGHKWDVDGNQYIDYWMGHGALLLGHRHPEVISAVSDALSSSTHAGGCHPLEVEWAEEVVALVPSAELVRFTASGTEATLLAMRLARAATHRPRIVKFQGHFHGWHDYATFGVNPPFDRPTSLGIPEELRKVTTVLPADIGSVRRSLSAGDVAGVILEPTGASMGLMPLPDDFLAELRSVCDETGTILIFDEVITGFRYAPGGVQAITNVIPDLTALGKVLAGGLPGGAVAGRESVMELLRISDDPHRNRFSRVPHTGTFNASPPVSAAGTTTLRLVADGAASERAAALALRLRAGMQEAARQRGASWSIIGESSVFHWLPIDPRTIADTELGGADFTEQTASRKSARGMSATEDMRLALLRLGVDFPGYEGWVSAAHTEDDIDRTVEAFAAALDEESRP